MKPLPVSISRYHHHQLLALIPFLPSPARLKATLSLILVPFQLKWTDVSDPNRQCWRRVSPKWKQHFWCPSDAESYWHLNFILVVTCGLRPFLSFILTFSPWKAVIFISTSPFSFLKVFYKLLRGFNFGAISLKAGLFLLPVVCQGLHKAHPKRKSILSGIFQGWSSTPARPRAINPSLISMLSHISSAAHRAKASKWGWIFNFTLCNVMHQILPDTHKEFEMCEVLLVNLLMWKRQHVPLREGGWSHPT